MTKIECPCIADAYVAQSGSGYNTAELKAEENGDDKYILLGFQLPADIDPATIEKLELEMYVIAHGGDYDWESGDYCGDTMFFNALPPFNESTVNWKWHFNNSIYLGQDVLKTPIQTGKYYKILNVGMEYPDLLQPLLSHLTAAKKIYFSWKGSNTWQTYSSKEGGHPPRLIVTVPSECEESTHEVLEYCADGITEKRWRDCINGIWVEDSQVCPCYPEGAHEVIEYCPDGVTEKRWRDCVNGKWVTNSQVCPVPPECTEGVREVLEYCPDGVTEKRWRVCINGRWVSGSQRCPGEPEPFPCPIMCIAMGTPLVDALGPIREFRDKILRRSKVGRWFISFYYDRITLTVSPVILKAREWVKNG